jgi:hypothetical protein
MFRGVAKYISKIKKRNRGWSNSLNYKVVRIKMSSRTKAKLL